MRMPQYRREDGGLSAVQQSAELVGAGRMTPASANPGAVAPAAGQGRRASIPGVPAPGATQGMFAWTEPGSPFMN